MKAVLVHGLFPDRNRAFLKALCERFTVVAFDLNHVRDVMGLPLRDGWQVIGRAEGDAPPPADDAVAGALTETMACLREDLAASPLAPPGGWELPESLVDELVRPRVVRALQLRALFEQLHAKLPLGLVISNADYDGERRPLVLAARRAGVTTLNIDHGFYFNATRHRCKPATGFVPPAFASEYVNVDNDLEAFVLRDVVDPYPPLRREFLPLGTPQDATGLDEVGRADALSRLGLDGDRRRVLLLGSWVEARSLGGVLAGQLDIVAQYEELFRTFAASGLAGDVDLLVKLHPALCAPHVHPGVRQALAAMAADAGLPAPAVYTDRLPELLSVADAVVSESFTSVLWEAFQRRIPAVLWLPRYWSDALQPGWRRDGTLPLEYGVQEAAADGDGVWRRIGTMLAPGYRDELDARAAALTADYALTVRDPAEKCARICDWAARLLA